MYKIIATLSDGTKKYIDKPYAQSFSHAASLVALDDIGEIQEMIIVESNKN